MSLVTGLARLQRTNFVAGSYGKFQPGKDQEKIEETEPNW